MLKSVLILICMILIIYIISKIRLRIRLNWEQTGLEGNRCVSFAFLKIPLFSKGQKTRSKKADKKRKLDKDKLEDIFQKFTEQEELWQDVKQIGKHVKVRSLRFITNFGLGNPFTTSIAIASLWTAKSICMRKIWDYIRVPDQADICLYIEPNYNEIILETSLEIEVSCPIGQLIRMYIISRIEQVKQE